MLNEIISAVVIASRPTAIVVPVGVAFLSFGVAGSKGRRLPPFKAFAVLFMPFFVLSIWGGANWASEQNQHFGHWRTVTEDVFAVVSIILVISVPIWFRGTPGWWILIPAALFGLYLIFISWLVGSMAISNNWL